MTNSIITELFNQFVKLYYVPGNIVLVGITGRAGAGKTTFAENFKRHCDDSDVDAVLYQGDWDFKLSSKERKVWLEEPRQNGHLEEYAERANQETWWDFRQMAKNLKELKRGNPVELNSVYDRRTGEKNLTAVVYPPDKEGIILLENAFIGDVVPMMEGVIFLHADPKIAFDRIVQKDGHRKSFYDLLQRTAETTWSEDMHWKKYMSPMLAFGDRFIAIDNNDYSRPKIMNRSEYSAFTQVLQTPFDGLLVPSRYLTNSHEHQ